jgi:hypothetical protein
VANDVFANGREISCKAGDGKSLGCFPDVCFTPPDKTPATPLGVPVPYPSFGKAKDASKGSKNVTISGKEIMLRDKSFFKTSTGDEAAKPTQKKGLMTSKVQGKVYFTSWSPNVKLEKQNAVRHLDMTTHNHACANANALTTPHQDSQAPDSEKKCPDYKEDKAKACKDSKPIMRKTSSGGEAPAGMECSEECKKAQACVLVPKGQDKKQCCSPDTTGDHLIEDHMTAGAKDFRKIDNLYQGAPCMCVNRSRYKGKHGIAHGIRGVMEDKLIGKPLSYSQAKKMALLSHKEANPESKCDEKCIEAQLDAFYGPEEKQCNSPTRRQPLKSGQRAQAEARVSQLTGTPAAGTGP